MALSSAAERRSTVSDQTGSQIDPAIEAVDRLLASGGLEHGRRRIRNPRTPSNHGEETLAAPVRSDLEVRGAGATEWLGYPGWQALPWLVHGFSTRRGGCSTAYQPEADPPIGELNLGFTAADTRENVLQNRTIFVRSLMADGRTGKGAGKRAAELPLISLKQIHSGITYRVDGACSREAPRSGDGVLTDEAGLLLGIQTADCVPVLVVDRKRRAVAAFHAGWRGTLKRIVEGGIGRMRLEFGSRPKNLEAAIGPAIGPCCYSVGAEVRSEFESQFSYAGELFSELYDADPVKEKYPLLFMTARAPGHSDIGPSLHLDLIEANRRQLLDAGLSEDRIHVAHACTSCHTEQFFSHRAERGFCGRMMSVIGMRE